MSVGRRIGGSLMAAVLVLLALETAPSLAFGSPSNGEITRAQVSLDWTVASIAGSANTTVQASECLEPPDPPEEPEEEGRGPWEELFWPETCSWIPYATAGPGTSQADCSSPGRRRNSLGEDVQLVWSGDEMENPGSISFDLSGIALAHGSSAPLLCLSAVEAVLENTAECPQDGSYCPPNYSVVDYYQQLDSALLEPVAPPAESVVGPILPPGSQPVAIPTGKARHCRTVNPRRRAKGSHSNPKSNRHAAALAAKHKPLKLCLSRLARVG
jgi:hypothetical protein